MSQSARLKLVLALGAASIAFTGPASAQRIEEIIVTAQKREQSAQDVPIALTAYTGEFLRDFGLRELDEVSEFVPGLQVQLQSPNNPGLVVRGITSDSGSAQQEARVSLFVDGVAASRARGAIVELYDIERIEVLKGPQGTLFGRGAQIGAVSIVTNKPDLEKFGLSGRVGIGNDAAREYEAAVNVPVADTAAVRLAGIYRKRDGYIDNIAGGEALNGPEVTALRGSVRFEPSDVFALTAIVNFQEDDYTGTSFKSRRFAPQGGDTSPFTAAQLNRGEALGVERDLFNVTVQGEWTLSDSLSLTAITGYREFNSFEEFDADGTQAFALEFAEDAQGEQWSQEFRLNFSAGDRFEGFAGVSWFQEEGFQRVPFQTNERTLLTLLNPAAGPLILPNGQPNALVPSVSGLPLRTLARAEFTNSGENTAYEAFADGTFRLTPQLSITAGIRFTYEEQESGFQQSVDQTPSLTANVFPNRPFRSLSDEFESVVGRVVATYEPTDASLFYASVSKGRRPAIVNVGANVSNVLDAEEVWSYEAGGKVGLLENRLQLEGAVFLYDYSNFQTSVIVPNNPVAQAIDGGEADAAGFELAATAQLTDWALAFATYGYISAEFADTDENGNRQIFAGNTFRLTPEHSASAGMRFDAPLSDTLEAFFAPTFTWKSRVFFEDANQPGVEEGGYGLLNLRGGVQAASGAWALTAYVTNALDREYLIDAGNTGGLFGIPTFIAGPPRYYGVEASFRF